jgi:glycyl-tRNA synthetase
MLQGKLESNGSAEVKAGEATFTIKPNMVSIKKEMVKVSGRNFVPGVIEPSFGIGRIMYAMFEHCYYCREVG